MHLLLVDDDTRIRELLKQYLVKNDYQVSTAENAESAAKLMQSFAFDLIVLDVMMPGEDGISFAKKIRQNNNVPIIMLTARGGIDDRLEGLKSGVDDFMAKPFDPRELLLRIEAILRRASTEQEKSYIVRFGHFIFDINDARLICDGEKIDLTRTEKDLLIALAQEPERTKSREELASALGFDDESSRAIDVQITRLRKKIEEDPKRPRFIETARGLGYRLNIGN